MPETITKDKIVQAVQALPDDATLEDAFERLLVLHKIEKGLQQAGAEQSMTQDEVEAYFKERRETWQP